MGKGIVLYVTGDFDAPRGHSVDRTFYR
jgi:hypothetical protein